MILFFNGDKNRVFELLKKFKKRLFLFEAFFYGKNCVKSESTFS